MCSAVAMSMINKVFLQRSLRGAQAKKQVKARTADVQRRAAAVRQQELAESRRLVATMRQDRERARMEAKRRKEARNGGFTTRSRLSRSAPLLPSASNTRSAPVPRLPLAKLTTSAAMSARGKVTVMPADAKTLRTPTNLWKAVNEQVAREARRDAMLEKQRKQALAVRVWVCVGMAGSRAWRCGAPSYVLLMAPVSAV